MNKYLKYGLFTAGGAAVIVIGGMAYVAATFDPNAYKPQIIKAVKDSKQRDLKLGGDIKLTFFPSIGASVDKVSLSEFKSDKEFASLDNARVSLALMPLLSKQIVVNEITLSGAKVHLVKYKNGKTNIDDLLGGGEPPAKGKPAAKEKPAAAGSAPPVKLDIASVDITNTELSYRDEGSGAHYAVKDLNLKTGRIANGMQSPVEFSAQVQANQPKVDLSIQAKTDLTIDLDKNTYQLAGLDLQAKGNAAGISNLAVQANGDAGADLGSKTFNTRKLTVAVSGKQGGNDFEVKLDSPRIEATGDKFSGEKLQLAARLKGANDITATLALPAIEGTAKAFGSKNLSLSMDAKGDALPGKHVSSKMKGSFAYDGNKQNFSVNLAGGLLQSKVKAMVAVSNFAKPFIRFDADVDQFDADLYFPPAPKSQGGSTAQASSGGSTPEKPFDLSGLKQLNLEGKLHIGALKASNVKSSNINITVKARNGVLNVNPLSARLYDGGIKGSVTVNAAHSTPSFAVRQSLTGINIGPLLKDAADVGMLEGKGNVALNVTTRGNTVSALKKALGGSASVNLADGAIKGINIAKKLRDAQAMFGKGGSSQTQSANTAEKTDFSELKASFKIKNGVAHNDDLSLKSPLLRVTGNGDINVGQDSLNYVTKATLVGSLKGQGGQSDLSGITVPVRLSGPFSNLKYTLDFGAMVGQAAKQKVKTKLEDKLKEGLKGLFR